MDNTRMKILITGAQGMLGRTLTRHWVGRHTLVLTGRAELDITDVVACSSMLRAERPEVVVHCAAHTAVDRCETEVDAAYRLNAIGSQNIAIACQRAGARLVAISTDYVFSGELDRPYHEWDATGPHTVYGASKLAGEHAVRNHCADHVIARISWLYGAGGPSFVHTMLKLGAQAGPALRVVADQIGNPTSTDAVAGGLEPLLERGVVGTVHLTCAGEASWYDFTRAILARAGLARGVDACTSVEYPRPAPRPANSRLDKMALRLHGIPAMPDWHEALERFLTDFPQG